MTYNPAKHHRRSIRLKAYDYSSLGYYFITLCIHDRWIRMFGDVDNGKMVLNDCGIIANEWIGYYRMNTGKHINAICKTSGNPVWQRNYWEHIIRNENEHIRISQYIIENSLNWDLDQLNGGGGNRVLEPAMPYGEESWII